ncbi:VOC family protein [Rathayibacter sp. VKM Ac-2760]|uniref:VOC family protein n=1 Tax=Rathayibacter sp. VKM Ac-2760 TaxID=2609253 RepID=UPI001316E8B7|nr:VOC family protein [Rathayibacter sp. VKM Ac-2760]QHC57821.1 glyoxalase/bleomycin resistance/dioxygenase family protein [Rathayibacter sp. VKM Ac-2760]
MTSPLVSAVAHSGLTVTDLDDSVELWCSGLGFTLERAFTLDADTTVATTGVDGATIRGAVVTLGDHRVELLQYDPPRSARAAGSPADIGTVHIALTVSDLDRVLGLCAVHGWRPVGPPHRMTSGARAGTRIVYLEGALGGFLELIAPPRRPQRGPARSLTESAFSNLGNKELPTLAGASAPQRRPAPLS